MLSAALAEEPPEPALALPVGTVLVEGQVEKIELLGAEGEFTPPGPVPAGRYLVLATWARGAPFVAGRISVTADEVITLRCDESFALCLPVKTPGAQWEGSQTCEPGESRVRFEGDALKTVLVGEGDTAFGPGPVEPATYRIWAEWIDGEPELAGLVRVREGEEVTVRCAQAFAMCKATEAACTRE